MYLDIQALSSLLLYPRQHGSCSDEFEIKDQSALEHFLTSWVQAFTYSPLLIAPAIIICILHFAMHPAPLKPAADVGDPLLRMSWMAIMSRIPRIFFLIARNCSMWTMSSCAVHKRDPADDVAFVVFIASIMLTLSKRVTYIRAKFSMSLVAFVCIANWSTQSKIQIAVTGGYTIGSMSAYYVQLLTDYIPSVTGYPSATIVSGRGIRSVMCILGIVAMADEVIRFFPDIETTVSICNAGLPLVIGFPVYLLCLTPAITVTYRLLHLMYAPGRRSISYITYITFGATQVNSVISSVLNAYLREDDKLTSIVCHDAHISAIDHTALTMSSMLTGAIICCVMEPTYVRKRAMLLLGCLFIPSSLSTALLFNFQMHHVATITIPSIVIGSLLPVVWLTIGLTNDKKLIDAIRYWIGEDDDAKDAMFDE